MFKKILILGMVLIVCLGILVGCEGEKNTGAVISEPPFYSLQAAYNEGLLNKRQLKTIAKRHKYGYDKTLSEDIESKIMHAYAESHSLDGQLVIKGNYYGTYGNCVIIKFGLPLSGFWDETIGGVGFVYPSGERLYVWKK